MKRLLIVFALMTLALPVFADEWGDWAAPQVFWMQSAADAFKVQLGPLPAPGRKSAMQCLALAFFKNDAVLKTYSARDIAKIVGEPDTARSHYDVFGKKSGFYERGGHWLFEIEDFKGNILTFDAQTGEFAESRAK